MGANEGGIASVLLREREVQRRLEASQTSLQEAQLNQEVMRQRLKYTENARLAAQAALDDAKVLPAALHCVTKLL